MKATSVVINGERKTISKDPITDSGMKKSAKGLLKVYRDESGELQLLNNCTEVEEESGELKTVFENGKLLIDYTLSDIRNRIEQQLDN